jgi:YfiR/HmsC-like
MAILGVLALLCASRHRSRWGCGLLALAVALFAVSTAPAADPGAASEYQIKAVFLFNFTKYVDWPATAFADAQAPLVIGVLGDDPFGVALDETVQGEKVNGRALVVRRYHQKEEIKDCQILFVSQTEAPQLEQIVAGLKGRSVLTVGDTDKFTDRGGMIWLVTENNKIRLKINLDAAKAANLTISSNLLRAAEVTGHTKD